MIKICFKKEIEFFFIKNISDLLLFPPPPKKESSRYMLLTELCISICKNFWQLNVRADCESTSMTTCDVEMATLCVTDTAATLLGSSF